MCCVFVICSGRGALAQSTLRPAPPPLVTAETQQWYQTGEPLFYAGNYYYPAGAQVHFNGNEMVRTGFYQGVPLYSRTTIEPFSIVFVPVRGGVMQPYERRRDGELAGLSGSSAPSFPVASPAEIAPGIVTAFPIVQAPTGPTESSATLMTLSEPVPTSARFMAAPSSVSAPRGPAPARAARPVATRPGAANGVFIEYDNSRWFSSGPATVLDRKTFTRIGDLGGLPVYAASGRAATIYVTVAEGLDMVAPYSKRDR
jgi:hypothetical protein